MNACSMIREEEEKNQLLFWRYPQVLSIHELCGTSLGVSGIEGMVKSWAVWPEGEMSLCEDEACFVLLLSDKFVQRALQAWRFDDKS